MSPSEPPHEPGRTSLKQGWVTLVLVIVVSGLFGLIVLPTLNRGRSSKLEGQPARDFSLEVIAGGEPGNRLALKSLAGKVVVLDFWASWCGPCRQQMPIVDQSAQRHRDDAVFLGVATSEPREDSTSYLRSQSYSYTMLYDDAEVASAYQVRGLPTLVIIGKSGKVSAVRARLVRADELEKLVGEAASR